MHFWYIKKFFLNNIVSRRNNISAFYSMIYKFYLILVKAHIKASPVPSQENALDLEATSARRISRLVYFDRTNTGDELRNNSKTDFVGLVDDCDVVNLDEVAETDNMSVLCIVRNCKNEAFLCVRYVQRCFVL